MRQQYVDLVKEYINLRPDYQDTLHEMKQHVVSAGATDEEFEEALKQLGIPLPLARSLSQDKKTEYTKETPASTNLTAKLIELDVLVNLIVLTVVLIVGAAYFFKMITVDTGPVRVASNSTAPAPKKLVFPQVYASSEPIDAQKVFSYPPSGVTLAQNGKTTKEIYGFFPYWMLDAQDQISFNTISRMALFGLETDGSGKFIVTQSDGTADGGWNMWNDDQLSKLLARARSKRIKVELTVKAFNNDNIIRLTQSDDAQQTFISNVIQALQAKNLDGVNLDFEYVGFPDDNIKNGFTRLVRNLRASMQQQIPNASLTIDTYINEAATPRLVDLSAVSDSVDALIIMGYDMHTPKGSPGPVAPAEGDVSITQYVQTYLDKVPADKLILAVPYYGYDWLSPNPQNTPATVIPYAQAAAVTRNVQTQWNDTTQTPWYTYTATDGSAHEVHFDNPRSLGIKYDLVNREQMRGIAIWALGYDGLNSDLRATIIDKFGK